MLIRRTRIQGCLKPQYMPPPAPELQEQVLEDTGIQGSRRGLASGENRGSFLPRTFAHICKTWEECWESSFFFLFLESGKEREVLLNSEKLCLVAERSINENRFGTFWKAVKMLIRLRAPVVTGDLSVGWSRFLCLWTCLWIMIFECMNINNAEWLYLLSFCGCNVVLVKRKKEVHTLTLVGWWKAKKKQMTCCHVCLTSYKLQEPP